MFEKIITNLNFKFEDYIVLEKWILLSSVLNHRPYMLPLYNFKEEISI